MSGAVNISLPQLDWNSHPRRVPLRRELRWARPENAEHLYDWVRLILGYDVPRTPVAPGSTAPFDYLSHAFFEDSPGPRDCVVWANRGGGKTQLGAIATLLDMLFKPDIQIRILGGSLEQSFQMHRHLRGMFAGPVFKDRVRGNITQHHIELKNGSRVELLAQSERSVRGTRIHKLRCDEVELFHPEIWEAAQLVTRSADCGGVPVRGCIESLSTMYLPYGMMHRLVNDPQRKLFRWNVLDTLEHCEQQRECDKCPLLSACGGLAKLPAACGFAKIDDAINHQHRVGIDTWNAEMLCTTPNRGSCVYPEFSIDLHTFGDDDDAIANASDGTWIGGLDFGYRDSAAVLLARIDQPGVIHVMDELVASGTIVSNVIDAAERKRVAHGWPRPEWMGADPAGNAASEQTGRTTISLWKRAGWEVRSIGSDIAQGIAQVRARLRAADGSITLRIHKRCTHLIESITKYHYPTDQPRVMTPVKDGSDHLCDALRYMVVNLDRLPVVTRTY